MVKPFGEARLVGSVALDLIVKRDIDVHLLTTTPDIPTIIEAISRRALACEKINEVRISDYRPRGMKVGIDVYPGPSGTWSIDIWVTNHTEHTGFELVERLTRELTPEHRVAIMDIKQALYQQGRLCDGISTRVYLAILDAGIHSLYEFEQIDQQHG